MRKFRSALAPSLKRVAVARNIGNDSWFVALCRVIYPIIYVNQSKLDIFYPKKVIFSISRLLSLPCVEVCVTKSANVYLLRITAV